MPIRDPRLAAILRSPAIPESHVVIRPGTTEARLKNIAEARARARRLGALLMADSRVH